MTPEAKATIAAIRRCRVIEQKERVRLYHADKRAQSKPQHRKGKKCGSRRPDAPHVTLTEEQFRGVVYAAILAIEAAGHFASVERIMAHIHNRSTHRVARARHWLEHNAVWFPQVEDAKRDSLIGRNKAEIKEVERNIEVARKEKVVIERLLPVEVRTVKHPKMGRHNLD